MVISKLSSEFPMSDLGPLSFFLGIVTSRSKSGLFLSQYAFAQEILARADMVSCNPYSKPADTRTKLTVDGEPVPDPTLYRSLVGALQYLTFTRPDIAYAVQQVCLFMHDPRLPHLNALKRILRYLKGTLSHGLHIKASVVDRLVAYSDADWAGCPNTRRSTSGFCVYLGDNLVSWSSKRQHVVSRSSAEAEYRGIANVVAETAWLRNLLLELCCPLSRATVVFCDNVSAMYLASNPVQHQRTKHVEIDLHFVRERVAIGHVRVLHVPSAYQYADIFTKGLPTSLFFNEEHILFKRLDLSSMDDGCASWLSWISFPAIRANLNMYIEYHPGRYLTILIVRSCDDEISPKQYLYIVINTCNPNHGFPHILTGTISIHKTYAAISPDSSKSQSIGDLTVSNLVPWNELSGKVVMVTGASSGIGREFCLDLAKADCKIVAAARRVDRLVSLCDEINGANNVVATAVELDVAKGPAIETSMKKAWDAFGRIDCLINNAGVRGNVMNPLELSEKEWDNTMGTNLTGTWLVSKYVCKRMHDANIRGSVINISSSVAVGRVYQPGVLAYASSKSGVITLTKVMAMELGMYNIRVNSINPGLFKSEITEGLLKNPGLYTYGRKTIPLKIPDTPGTTDPALTSLVRYLIDDSSEYINGNTFIVDAGHTLPGVPIFSSI
ncbi:hypothetical protein OSB04_020673 [Centaurea solstitialis]|uniref:Uncharacterized protein n=1 Tax=Centaurea solstitialis TaxID=347529 RepID=A0AA38SSQ1_9ASTR|nr:hypothetical protein OSB04_020673 [Centaurea solstitialis]